jgi:hypothetical protein
VNITLTAVRVAEGLEEIAGLGKAELDPVLLKAVEVLNSLLVRHVSALERFHTVLRQFDG